MPKRPANAPVPAALSVVILAAGEGKRMKAALPKVLQPLAGTPLLKRVIDTARELSPAAICVVYGHGGERVREALRDEPVIWVPQRERLGTGHALLQALPHIPDAHTVLVLYGDVPLIRAQTLRELLALAGPRRLSLLTVKLDEPSGYGRIVRNARGEVRKIVEHQEANRRELSLRECNTGVLVCAAGLLKGWLARVKPHNSQGEYYLTDVIALAVKEGIAVKPLIAREATEVLGVNDKTQLAQLESTWRAQVTRELMLAGVTLADPARLDVRGTLRHGTDVFLDVNVVIEGRVTLGDRVRIGPGCLLRNTDIGADTEVFAHCVIDSAVIGEHCNIGPFARFRPSSTLADSVHIGNFVEVKNSQLGAGSKANHLAYVGDAQLGARVNVGAGTIVANYDGAHKHRTLIADDVHTGSNSVLVAPISVGAGATIGAGSTVTHSVPAGKLTLARARQVTLEEWQRPRKSKK
ncbi:MAG TPA: bifunctional UDP-N-acetylglucosamine diphosphorylase/glucosamine-1-phosphate N-acetyltransferase GlmU [Steroidobacteraceae bacterium]|jgi:bifunctional UDP-N-acetylglucosamine pyrophosphorylase / glucosamine-1-phosphate N-acetyltransferase|nr:bifunctional UDP-N-acetylglucosamine diphosphorylase/glucosamine-1-phosphate N-acetyltransferase GlmU [Steroidobacteraceae bacterium]